MVNPGLQIDGVSVRYGLRRGNRVPQLAISEVSLNVGEGEVVALLGPSGSGKSTLLRAVAGLEPLHSGRILWNGSDLARTPTHLRGIGMVFQSAQLFPHLTVAKNIGYGLRGPGWNPSTRSVRVGELLELIGLVGSGEKAVTQLSGGEQQRVALARSLAPTPRVLLLDEPLSSLDRELRERLAVDIRDILQVTGTTAILVTHDAHEAATIAQRTVRMRDGSVREHG